MNKTAKENKAMLLAHIAQWEKKILAADDAELTTMADALAAEEKSVTQAPPEVSAGQNARANDNWPMQARVEIAKKLTKLASALLAEDDEEEAAPEADATASK